MPTVYAWLDPSAAVTVTAITLAPTASGHVTGAALHAAAGPPLAAATTITPSPSCATVAVTSVLSTPLLTGGVL